MKTGYPSKQERAFTVDKMQVLLQSFRDKTRTPLNGYPDSIGFASHKKKFDSVSGNNTARVFHVASTIPTHGVGSIEPAKIYDKKTNESEHSKHYQPVADKKHQIYDTVQTLPDNKSKTHSSMQSKADTTLQEESDRLHRATNDKHYHNQIRIEDYSPVAYVPEPSVQNVKKVRVEVGIHGDNFPEGLIVEIQEVSDPVHLNKNCKIEVPLSDFPDKVLFD